MLRIGGQDHLQKSYRPSPSGWPVVPFPQAPDTNRGFPFSWQVRRAGGDLQPDQGTAARIVLLLMKLVDG
ncbi:hypothetical protein PX52LOC_04614 [Limnoglobus roseus]|uniref:Uncharacterized protein n=1 Tax=Limnoglobus roseus TaxID=2598579 RepID=A0A5C1AHZ1_9BACT|nr:hypothetical protein PX52LOC_04614 [Limnoglobus roseus]